MQDLPGGPSSVPTPAAAARLTKVPQLQVAVSHTGPQCTVRLDGELDMATAGQLREVLQRICEGSHQLVVVDLGELWFLSLAGLQVLAQAHQSLQEAGCRLVLSHPDPLTARVLAITGLDQILHVMPDTTQAEAAPDAGVGATT